IQGVAASEVDPHPDPHLDALLRRALDLPKEDWDLVHLARQLDLGVWEAKRLETSLRIFEGGAYRVTTKPAPELAKAAAKPTSAPPPKAMAPKKVEEVRDVKRCVPHQAKAVSRHPCGTWLCSSCLDAEACPSCGNSLHVPKIAVQAKQDPARPGVEEKDRPPRRRDEDANRDFSRL
ncbi:MAG TPA: hypothetical protein VEM95_06835, partial [Thermoplasmata archaeon]|nr:hypothetical protein [Thermoplasmata archaeon]